MLIVSSEGRSSSLYSAGVSNVMCLGLGGLPDCLSEDGPSTPLVAFCVDVRHTMVSSSGEKSATVPLYCASLIEDGVTCMTRYRSQKVKELYVWTAY